MQATRQVPDTGHMDPVDAPPPLGILSRPHQPMAGRLQHVGNIEDRLGASAQDHSGPDILERHEYHKVGHIKRNCTQRKEGAPKHKNSKQ